MRPAADDAEPGESSAPDVVVIPDHVPGSSAYWNKRYGCQHPACIAAASSSRVAARAKQWENRYKVTYGPGEKDWYWFNPNVPTHGVTSNGYNGYGCRCLLPPGPDGKPRTNLTPRAGDRPGCGPVGRAAARGPT